MQECVDRGVKWLDKNYPDWLWRVNVNLLALSDCKRCVLGQLFGLENYDDFSRVVVNIAYKADFLSQSFAAAHGFDFDADKAYFTGQYEKLTKTWKATITRLRAERIVGETESWPSISYLSGQHVELLATGSE